ncbi:MAG TPA: hypothetical protein VGF28_04415 [Thermoanaerobaculia bacterium]
MADLQQASVTVSDFRRILREKAPPADADITLILDSCYAEQFDSPKDPVLVPLFVQPPDAFREGIGSITSFHDGLAPLVFDRPVAEPLLMAACERHQTAWEVPAPDDKRRLLFSKRALERFAALNESRESFKNFMASLLPLHPAIEQTATLAGDDSPERQAELMFGEPGNTPTASSGKADTKDAQTTAESNGLTIRVLGLACIIPQGPLTGGVKRRIVAPLDDIGTSLMRHFSFIEVPREDLIFRSGIVPDRYRRGGVDHFRWNLSRHRVTFDNIDGSQSFSTGTEYDKHVPHMRKVCPELPPLPRDECYKDTPEPTLFTAFYDFAAATVTLGALEQTKTIFIRPTGEVTWPAEYTPTSILLKVPTTGPETLITIADSTGTVALVKVRSGARLMIGNAREVDITGSAHGENPSYHFKIMYKLAPVEPPNAPVPASAQVPIDSCSVTNWP